MKAISVQVNDVVYPMNLVPSSGSLKHITQVNFPESCRLLIGNVQECFPKTLLVGEAN